MSEHSGKGKFSYAWALLAVGTVAAVRMYFGDAIEDPYVLLMYVPIVALVSWIGGVGPGLFATLLSAGLAGSMFQEKIQSHPDELIGLGLYIVTCSLVIAMTHSRRRTPEPQMAAPLSVPAVAAERENRLKEVFDSTWDVAIVVMDRTRTIKEWNPGASQLTGYSRGEVIGRSADELFPSEDVTKGDPKREQALAEATGKAPITRWMRKKDGKRFFADGMMRPTCNAMGELNGFIKVFVDGTQRLQATQEMEQLFLDRAEQLKKLTYSMAHDMRQYARGVTVNVASIRHDLSTPIDEEVRVSLERAEWNSKAMNSMVDGLIEYMRLGQVTVNAKPVNMSVLAAQLVASAVPNLQLECQPDLWVRADPDLLRDLLLNLFSNAAKYGGGKAWLGRDPQSKQFFVRDQGVGFKDEQAARIFSPFVRLQSQHVEGIGIGLSNALRIAQAHGGDMKAASEGEGLGATFYFTLSEEESAVPDETPVQQAPVSGLRPRAAVVATSSVGARL